MPGSMRPNRPLQVRIKIGALVGHSAFNAYLCGGGD
jgi:hypothetical protein